MSQLRRPVVHLGLDHVGWGGTRGGSQGYGTKPKRLIGNAMSLRAPTISRHQILCIPGGRQPSNVGWCAFSFLIGFPLRLLCSHKIWRTRQPSHRPRWPRWHNLVVLMLGQEGEYHDVSCIKQSMDSQLTDWHVFYHGAPQNSEETKKRCLLTRRQTQRQRRCYLVVDYLDKAYLDLSI